MLRLGLALLLIAALGGLGFYFTHAAKATSVPVAERPEVAAPAPEDTQARARTNALPDEGPAIPPNSDVAGIAEPPKGPLSEAPIAPAGVTIPGGQDTPDVSGIPAPRNPAAKLQETDPARFDRALGMPIFGLKSSDIRDTFDDSRGNGERRHEATDIMAPRGTPVHAVDTGLIKKLFDSKPGGLTVYQYDALEKYAYYYAHLDRYAEGVREGTLVKRGDVIGYVGSTGNADPNAPHLHFGILQLGPEKKWWEDTIAINPYPILMRARQRQ